MYSKAAKNRRQPNQTPAVVLEEKKKPMRMDHTTDLSSDTKKKPSAQPDYKPLTTEEDELHFIE